MQTIAWLRRLFGRGPEKVGHADGLQFELTQQAQRMIDQYDLDRGEVIDYHMARSRQIGGEQIQQYLVDKAEGNIQRVLNQ